MPDLAQNLILLLIFAVLLAILAFLFSYFTKGKYADRQEKKIQSIVLISSINLILAFLQLAKDIIAWYRKYLIMVVRPTEHRYSLQLVLAYMILALLVYIIVLLIVHRRLDDRWLPGLVPLLGLTILAVALSTFSVYISRLGFCCETPLAIFSGFPFSYVQGYPIADNIRSEILQQMSLIDILDQNGSKLGWYFDLSHFILDCLFWGSGTTILLMVFQRLFRMNPTNPSVGAR